MNGKFWETIRWVLALGLAALISYYTTLGTMKAELAVVKSTEENHFAEVQRSLARIERAMERLEDRRP